MPAIFDSICSFWDILNHKKDLCEGFSCILNIIFSWIKVAASTFLQNVWLLFEGDFFIGGFCLPIFFKRFALSNSFSKFFPLIYLLHSVSVVFSNSSTTVKYSTWNHYFAVKFAWYWLKCFDYSFLCQLSEEQKQGEKNVVVKHSEENSYQEAAEKYSINENVASFYFRLASIFYFLHLNCGFCLNLSSIERSFYLRKYTSFRNATMVR